MPVVMLRDLELIQGYLSSIHNIVAEVKEKKELSNENFEDIEENIEAINKTIRALRF